MGPFLASAAAGLLVLPLLPALPGWGWSLLPAPLLLFVFHYRRRRWWLWPLPALMAFAWAVSVAGQALEAAPPSTLEQKPLQVSGTVAGLAEPDRYGGWKMRLRPDARALEGWVPRGLWQLHVRSADMPLPGARCRLTVRLKRPHGVANPGGFDYEAWLLSEGVTATGSGRHLVCTAPPASVDGVRLQVREHFHQHLHQRWPDQPEAGVLLALITGDRVLVPADAWERYAATGVIHLMAISGLHITLLAVVTAWLAWQVLVWIPGFALRMPVHKPALAVGLMTAAAYSMMAGFSVPTQRTLLMLLVVVVARWWQLRVPAFHVLTLALLAVLLRDPLAVHAVGFWLSFGAVALLMLVGRQQQHLPAWRQGVQLQLALSALLLPLTLGFFERASWVSPFANLLAVPLVTFVVVPLGLLGLLLWPLAPDAADTLWQLGMHVLTVLDALLAEFQQWPAASVDWSLPGRAGLLWAALAVFCLCQPLAPRLRLLAPFFLMPLFVVHQPPAPGQLRVTVLDVGQGLAVLVEAGRYRLLYDTGPAFGDSDAGRRIVLPALRQAGVGTLDHLLLSHDDLDHTGGAASLLSVATVRTGIGVPPSRYAGAAPLPPWRACDAGMFWMRAGWRFEVMHPDAGAQAAFTRDNDRSCVLRVSRGGRALLLPGDLERHSEAWLLANMPAAGLRADVLVLGHHGSRQASSAAFLEQVAPALAIASAGYRNAYGHPAVAVRDRLTTQGIPLRNTADSGALQFELGPAGVTGLQQWRVVDRRYWRHLPPDFP